MFRVAWRLVPGTYPLREEDGRTERVTLWDASFNTGTELDELDSKYAGGGSCLSSLNISLMSRWK
jgi:hypothetical protein